MQSGGEWLFRPVDFKDEKCSLVTFGMSKFMNLFYDFAVSHFTVVEDPLTDYLLDHSSVVCMDYVGYSLASNPLGGKSQGSNPNSGRVGNAGYPKCREAYGYGGTVVGTMLGNTKRLYSVQLPKGSSFKPGINSPLIISSECEKELEFASLDPSKLIHAISHVDVLLLAYELIANQGRHRSKETPDGIPMRWFYETSRKIQAGQYQFGLRRAKVGKRVPTHRENIIQKAITMVLTELFEPKFLDYSHGFRPNRGCHTALAMVDRTFRGGNWVIAADLSKCLFPHEKLLKVLSYTIPCRKTLALIASALKGGYVVLGNVVTDDVVATPQESILTPLLSNIYLHELDLFMQELVHTVGKNLRENPVYSRSKQGLHPNPQRQLRRNMWKVDSQDSVDPLFRRLAYVRYADAFVICVTGPRKRAQDIKGKVDIFLREPLGLRKGKTLLTKFSDGIYFLGAIITNRIKPFKKAQKGPVVQTPITFHAPIRKLFDRLVLRGYFRYASNRAEPTAMRALVNQDHCNILLQYNALIRGLLNFYSFADNRKSLGSIIHGLKISCALTLALKYKLRTAAKAFREFGPLLVCPETESNILLPDTFARLHTIKFEAPLLRGYRKSPEKVKKTNTTLKRFVKRRI